MNKEKLWRRILRYILFPLALRVSRKYNTSRIILIKWNAIPAWKVNVWLPFLGYSSALLVEGYYKETILTVIVKHGYRPEYKTVDLHNGEEPKKQFVLYVNSIFDNIYVPAREKQ